MPMLLGQMLSAAIAPLPAQATPPRTPDQTVECEILIVGGGLAGTAAAYEALLAGRTVCLTEITDWLGGQVSAQGTSALDEARRMRAERFFPRGYNELRRHLYDKYGSLSSGSCWVSAACFLPSVGHEILWGMVQQAARQGKGQLKWFPNTVIKDLEYTANGKQISSAIAIQHSAAPGTPSLNTEPLSHIITDTYRYENSPRLTKQIIRFNPIQLSKFKIQNSKSKIQNPPWYVIEATETGEIIALADVPYRLGLDPISPVNPSSPVKTNDPYCTQGFTYTFAMERTATPQPQPMPPFYPQYAPYFSFETKNNASVNKVFTYRRIWSPDYQQRPRSASAGGVAEIRPGDISMQNWTWGNDYRPGTSVDNLIYSREQLQQRGELAPGGWLGGLRTETLQRAEENAIAFYYWLVAGTTDSQLGAGVKQPDPNYRYVSGLNSPLGTVHGLSKYPYIREARRIIGRPSVTFPKGFSINEIDVAKIDYREPIYKQNLTFTQYQTLWKFLAGLEFLKLPPGEINPDQIKQRTRSTIYPDSVGISQYAIDFHPCMQESPPEKPGNIERPGVRQAHGPAYPGEIPLRAMIPQKLDNLLVAGKAIATSTIAAADYRVHPFEWSVGAAAGTTAAFSLSENVMPYQLVDHLSRPEPLLEKLQAKLETHNNPTKFPDTSVFNLDWEEWKVW